MTPDWVKEAQKKKFGVELGRELTAYDLRIIALDGTYDESGNKYAVVWTILGAPLSAKISAKDGRKYIQSVPGGNYYYKYGCCEAYVLS